MDQQGQCDPRARLASAVSRRRIELGFTSRAALVQQTSAISERTLGDIEKQRKPVERYSPATIFGLESLLRWAPGSVDAILAGGEPTELPKPVEDAPDPEDVGPTLRSASKWELLAELARRLEEGGQRQDRQAVLDPNLLDPEVAEALGVDQDRTEQRRRA